MGTSVRSWPEIRIFLTLSQIALDSGFRKLVVKHEFTDQSTILSLLLEFQDFRFIELFASAKLNAVVFGFEDTFHLSFCADFGFKLGDRAQHIEDKPSGGVGGVNILIQDFQRDFLFLQRFGNLAQMQGGASQTVEAGKGSSHKTEINTG